MITPEAYGPVQVSLDTAFGDAHLWWDGAQWQAIPEDAKTAIKACEKLVAASRSRDGAAKARLAGALYQIGNAESRRGREAQALRAYEEILKRFSEDTDRALKGYVAAARVARGKLFARKAAQTKGKDRARTLQQALGEYRAVIERYVLDPDPGMHVWVAEALVESGTVIGDDVINNKAMAVVYYDAAMRRVKLHSGTIARRLTAFSGLNAGLQREHLGLRAAAISVTNQMLAALGDESDPTIIGYVAMARSNVASWLAANPPTGPPAVAAPSPEGRPMITPDAYAGVKISLDAFSSQGHFWWDGAQWLAIPDDAKAATKELQNTATALGQSPNGSTNVALAGALYQLGNAQGRLGREPQTLRAYDEVLQRFSADPDPALQGYVAAAMCGKGSFFALKADKTKPKNRARLLQQALVGYRAVIDRYANDPNPGTQVWVAEALIESGQAAGRDDINDKAMAIVYYDAAARLLSMHSGLFANRIKAMAGLNGGAYRAHLGLTSDAISTSQAMVDTFGDDLDATIVGYVATARSNIASWQNPKQTTVSPKVATPSPKRSSFAAVAAVFVGLLCAVPIVVVASRALNNPSVLSSGSQSAGGLNLGSNSVGNSAGSSGGNLGGVVPAPAIATPAPDCRDSIYGISGGWDLHHMVDATSTARCWAHETIDLCSGGHFFENGTEYRAPVNLWNIDYWGRGSGPTSGEYIFFIGTYSLIYTCAQNANMYPQTRPNPQDWS